MLKCSNFARSYQITFVTYEVFENCSGFITRGSLRGDDGTLITDQLNSIFIELSKLGDILNKTAEEMSPLEMWPAFLGYASDPNKRGLINDIIGRREPINMASNVLTTISKDDHERAKFRSRRKAETDRISNLLTAEARGEARGAEIEKKNIAINLFKLNLDIQSISIATGLSVEALQHLKNEL